MVNVRGILFGQLDIELVVDTNSESLHDGRGVPWEFHSELQGGLLSELNKIN